MIWYWFNCGVKNNISALYHDIALEYSLHLVAAKWGFFWIGYSPFDGIIREYI
jgi:hypothetical protein